MLFRTAVLAAFLCLLVSGCSMREVKTNYDSARNWVLDTEPTAKPSHVEDNTPIIELNYEAADSMDSDLWLKLSVESPIYFQNFTNLTNPNDGAPFGSVVADQLAARLAQLDRNVVSGEPRPDDYTTPVNKVRVLAPAPAAPTETEMEQEQDLAPDDEMAEASPVTMEKAETKDVKIQAEEGLRPILPSIMTGTYLVGDDVVFVSARVTTLRDKQLITAYQWTIPINQNTRMLLPQLLRPQRGMTPTVQTRF